MAKKTDSLDVQYMLGALALARRGLGCVAPNPAVGCVIVKDDGGRVVGRGWTQPGGRPHAETEALRRAGAAAKGATAYVTLEPCDHHGVTAPCSEALIKAGIKRAVVAVQDPDPRVSSSGIERLRSAGIEVTFGVCAKEAERLNAGFFLKVTHCRPLFTLKTATTLDGRIATHTGDSRWITGKQARAVAHLYRAEHDAVLIGVGTALHDNPRLSCRLPGMKDRTPIRIVADSRMRLPLTSTLVKTAHEHPTWIVTSKGGDKSRYQAYTDLGVKVIETEPDKDNRPDLARLAGELGRRGLTRVLVEGGGALSAGLLRRNLIDRVAWFRAGCLIGGDGVPAARAFGIDSLKDAPRFSRTSVREIGVDLLETYERMG